MSTNTATARTVIVCMPADKPIDWFSASEILDWHNLPTGTPRVMFPVRRPRLIGWFSRWSARHLVQVTRRFGAVVWAAGGRKSRLDLTAAATNANARAVYRWRIWAQVGHGSGGWQATAYTHPEHRSTCPHLVYPMPPADDEAAACRALTRWWALRDSARWQGRTPADLSTAERAALTA